MKAVTYAAFGAPLDVSDVDEPRLGPDSVLIAVRASSVNPVDHGIAAGGLDGYLDTFFPVIPGWDVSGVVEAVGPAVTHLVPGDEVFGYVR
ncbi:MAG: alcohol dehydrogenase catalytic domain-containing protein [Aeromicrobium sp.]